MQGQRSSVSNIYQRDDILIFHSKVRKR